MTSIEFPPARLKPLSADYRTAIAAEIEAKSPKGVAWLEKIRRFASLGGRNLKSIAKGRFGNAADVHLVWMRDLLFARCLDDDLVNQALLNAGLFCSDACINQEAITSQVICDTLRKQLLTIDAKTLSPAALGKELTGDLSHWASEAKAAKGIVIISPSPFSLATLCVYLLLRRVNAPITAIVIRKFTLNRFRQEWRRDGLRLLQKIWRKLVLRADENPDKTSVSLKKLKDLLKSNVHDIRTLARSNKVPVIEVADFNFAPTCLSDLNPQIAIFTGGGMIKSSFIRAFPKGIVNIHMGSLPAHKGMDVVQAPVLEGYFKDVALTAHLMERDLDAGPVLERVSIDSSQYRTLGKLRNELSSLMPILGVDAALGKLSGRLNQIEQSRNGKQYYFLHNELVELLSQVISLRFSRVTKTDIELIMGKVEKSLLKKHFEC